MEARNRTRKPLESFSAPQNRIDLVPQSPAAGQVVGFFLGRMNGLLIAVVVVVVGRYSEVYRRTQIGDALALVFHNVGTLVNSVASVYCKNSIFTYLKVCIYFS